MTPSTAGPKSPNVAVILAAAGKSRRFSGGETDRSEDKKPFVLLLGKPVWLHAAEKFAKRDDVRQLILVVSPEDAVWFRRTFADQIDRLRLITVEGGKERVDSVRNALEALDEEIDLVAIHDAARPCVDDRQIEEVFRKAAEEGAAILAAPVFGTVKRIRDGRIEETVPRHDLWEAQTPQVFRRDLLREAFDRCRNPAVTDDAQLVEEIASPVFIVPGDRWNIKITTPTDLTLAERIISGQNDEILPALHEKVNYDNLK